MARLNPCEQLGRRFASKPCSAVVRLVFQQFKEPLYTVAAAHLVSEGLNRTQGSCSCLTVAAVIGGLRQDAGADIQRELLEQLCPLVDDPENCELILARVLEVNLLMTSKLLA